MARALSDTFAGIAPADAPDFIVAQIAGMLLGLPLLKRLGCLPGWIDSLPQTEERRRGMPMQRYGTMAEIAGTVSFLASDAAGYITGQSLRVDGGLTRAV